MASTRSKLRLIGGTILGAAMIAVAIFELRAAHASTERATALVAAEAYAEVFVTMRALYTSEVVERLPDDVPVTHEYLADPAAVPIPATFTMELGERLGTAIPGLTVRLDSAYPFPGRADRVLDDFERRALEYLEDRPEETFSEVESRDGGQHLRFARGDPMRASCVSCHNEHPDSPKTDWQEGDLRGVLEISFPLASFAESAAAARRPYLMLLTLAIFGLLGATVMLVAPRAPRPRPRAAGPPPDHHGASHS